MKKYTFRQYIPRAVTGLTPKIYEFDDINDLLDTELFRKFSTNQFVVNENLIYMVKNGRSTMFGSYSENNIISEDFEYIKEYTPPSIRNDQTNLFAKSPTSRRELDLIADILKKPAIHIDDTIMEDQAKQLGENEMPDDRTPGQMLGLI